MKFDYEGAWYAIAKPGFDRLTAPGGNAVVVSAMHRIDEECGDLPQDRTTLDMPWPNIAMRELFEQIDSTTLAVASFVVYSYGHWKPGHEKMRVKETWKFANYADQVLRTRLGIVRDIGSRSSGYAFAVQNGLLELTYSARNEWNRIPVGFATEETHERARSVVNRAMLSVPTPNIYDIGNRVSQEADLLNDEVIVGVLGNKSFNIDEFMLSEERYEYVQACRKAERCGLPVPDMQRPKSNDGLAEWYQDRCRDLGFPFTVDRVTSINHRLRDGVKALKHPFNETHAFCIGMAHMARAQGSVLDPRSAPCDICGRDYDSHTADRVAVIRLLRSVPKSEALPHLESFVEEIKTDGLDGIVFVETEEKFRMTE